MSLMILPFSRFFTIVRNAVSTLCRWPKNSRLSTSVGETTFVRFILFRICYESSSNFLCLAYIHRPRCYQDKSFKLAVSNVPGLVSWPIELLDIRICERVGPSEEREALRLQGRPVTVRLEGSRVGSRPPSAVDEIRNR